MGNQMTADTTPTPLTFILSASKRGVKRDDRNSPWRDDTEGFLRRWPNNTRPDIGIQRAKSATELQKTATRLNAAQERGNFLDWLYYVDIDAPIHNKCTSECPTWQENAA